MSGKGRSTKGMVPHVDEKVSRHHRRPVAQGGRHYAPHNGLSNVVKLTRKEHEAWHTLFDGHMTPADICNKCNRLIDPDYYFELRRR